MKKEFPCDVVRNGGIEVPCDDTCKRKQQEEEDMKRAADLEKQKQQEEQNKRELEKFEKMFAKKKNRDRAKVTKEVVETNNTKKYIIIAICAVFIAVFAYFVLQTK